MPALSEWLRLLGATVGVMVLILSGWAFVGACIGVAFLAAKLVMGV